MSKSSETWDSDQNAMYPSSSSLETDWIATMCQFCTVYPKVICNVPFQRKKAL
jgi:hypothetical protein